MYLKLVSNFVKVIKNKQLFHKSIKYDETLSELGDASLKEIYNNMNDTIFKIDGSEANTSIEISGITRYDTS